MHIMHGSPGGFFNINPPVHVAALQFNESWEVDCFNQQSTPVCRVAAAWCSRLAFCCCRLCFKIAVPIYEEARCDLSYIHPCILKVNQPRLQIWRRQEQKRQLIARTLSSFAKLGPSLLDVKLASLWSSWRWIQNISFDYAENQYNFEPFGWLPYFPSDQRTIQNLLTNLLGAQMKKFENERGMDWANNI